MTRSDRCVRRGFDQYDVLCVKDMQSKIRKKTKGKGEERTDLTLFIHLQIEVTVIEDDGIGSSQAIEKWASEQKIKEKSQKNFILDAHSSRP